MNTYEYINHIINDCISDSVTEFGHMHFIDNIRYTPEILDGWELIPPHLCTMQDDLAAPHVEKWGNSSSLLDISHGSPKINIINDYDNLIQSRPVHNFKIYFEHQWEPIDIKLDAKFWAILYNHILQHRAKFFMLHSEKNSKEVDTMSRCGITPIHWFGHAYLCSEFYFRHYYKLKIAHSYKSRPIESRWICANRLIDNARIYRIKFLNMINLERGLYSLLGHDPQTGRTPNEILPDNRVQANSFDDHNNSSAEVLFCAPWGTSFLHIVNETIWGTKIHFTEKVFKPIVLHQPFVVLQAAGSLAYLHSYGFKTFGDWWDESYDTIEDDGERMQAIANIVNWIGSKDISELEVMREEMSSVLEHNFNHFYNNIPNIVLNELKDGIAHHANKSIISN